jgi:acetyl esterase/lipase
VTEAPSLRLRALRAALPRLVKPHLGRIARPEDAREEFERLAPWIFARPPHLLHLEAGGDPPLHWVSCGPARERGVMLYFHGGAYIAGSPRTHAGMIGRLAALTGLRVVAPAYRLAPETPGPAAFDDAMAAHARLTRLGYAPEEIVLAGDSAGGGLALALLSALCAEGRRPAGLVAFSPWTDLALGGRSLRTNARADPLLPVWRIDEVIDHVRGDLPPEDPRLSPLHAPFDAPPPVLIQVGDTEILHADSVRMAARLRQAGGDVRLEVWRGVPHTWQLLDGRLAEARAALVAASGFIAPLLAAPD